LEYVSTRIPTRNKRLSEARYAGHKHTRVNDIELRAFVAKNAQAMKESLSSKLRDVALPDCDGRETRLGSLWAAAPAVLVFLRHYG
jgi:hypothetical protein